jgi:hypothetical protein
MILVKARPLKEDSPMELIVSGIIRIPSGGSITSMNETKLSCPQ